MGKIVFSGGEIVEVSVEAKALLQNLSRLRRRERVAPHGQELPPGFVDVHTDAGVIYVNPDAVAYVCDELPSPPAVLPRTGGRPLTSGVAGMQR